MSGHGPQNVDKIRLTVKPLLDCIAPEYVFNQQAVLANRLARLSNSELPIIAEEGWQNEFYDKKIRITLQLATLDYNAWDEETDLERAKDLFNFLFAPKSVSKNLTDWIQDGLKKNALSYIRDIKSQATTQLKADWELNYSEAKALAAFDRMINVQMAFNFLEKLQSLKGNDRDDLLKCVRQKMPEIELNDLVSIVENFIQQQTQFSVNERILFRCHKTLQSSLNLDPFSLTTLGRYKVGATLDGTLSQSKELQQAMKEISLSRAQTAEGLKYGLVSASKAALLYPAVLLQQCHHFISQTTRIPFQFFSAWTQELPWVGPWLQSGARVSNGLKDMGLIGIEAGGLLWLSLLEITRMTGTSPEDNLRNSPIGEMMCAASPWLSTALKGYTLLATSGVLAYIGSLVVKKLEKKPELARNLQQTIIEENMAFFNENILTESLIAEHGDLVLNYPIEIPAVLKALLSIKEQDAIVEAIVEQRQQSYQRFKPEYAQQDMTIIRHQERWYPLFQAQLAPAPAPDSEVDDIAELVRQCELH